MERTKLLIVVFLLIFFLITPYHVSSQQNQSSNKAIRINVGGNEFTDTHGQTWMADHIYKSGSYGYLGISSTFETQETIKGTSFPDIYQSERYKLFGYRIDVPNGHYDIILHFAEIYHQKEGRRLMDVKIEGKTVEKSLDIFAKVGNNKALSLRYNTKEFNIPILDGRIDIDLVSKRDDTKLSGIEIIPLSEQPALVKIAPSQIQIPSSAESATIAIENQGSQPIAWQLEKGAGAIWISAIEPAQGTLTARQTAEVTIFVDRNRMSSGIQKDSLIFTAPGIRNTITVSAAKSGAAKLTLQSATLDFDVDKCQLACILLNEGGSPLKWKVPPITRPAWIKRIYPNQGELDMGENIFVNISVDRAGLRAALDQTKLTIMSTANSAILTLKIAKPAKQNRHIFVDLQAQGQNNGTSWENAFTEIKKALAGRSNLGSNEVVEIWVARGTYYEYGMMVPDGVHLYGGFQGNETFLEERTRFWQHQTIVDGMKRGRGFEVGHRTVIDGFTIQNCRDWNSGDGKGAAILAYEADVKIRNNLIRNNVDSWAGAVFIEGFETKKRVNGFSPLIERNVLINNSANYCAGAIEIRASKAVIRHNTIVRNYGFGLEIQDLLGPFQSVIHGKFYNNIVTQNARRQLDDVWAEARKATNYCYVGVRWHLNGEYPPYDYGKGNIFEDIEGTTIGFIDDKNNDFHLQSTSPAINSGDPQSAPDADGTQADLGAFPFNHNQTEIHITPDKILLDAENKTQKIRIRAYGAKPVKWQAAASTLNGRLIDISPSSGELSNGEMAELTVQIKNTSLPDGIYQGNIAVMTADQSIETDFSVQINHTSPEIAIQPQTVEATGFISGSAPENVQIKIENKGGGNFFWAILQKHQAPWLKLSKTSGQSGDVLTLHFLTQNLGFGNFYEEISFVGSGTVNKTVTLPVNLKIRPDKFLCEIQAENSASFPNPGWKITQNNGDASIQAIRNAVDAQNDSFRVDYEFEVPDGLEYVYVFAEVDVNRSRANDSFWIGVNDFDLCNWNYLRAKYDGWHREWVFNHPRDEKHMFVVVPGKNKLNLFSREKGAFINWFVITSDPNFDIYRYKAGK